MSVEFMLKRLEENGFRDVKFIMDGSTIKAIEGTHEIRKNVKQYRKSTCNSRWIEYTTKLRGSGGSIDAAFKQLLAMATYEEETLDVYKKGER